MRNEEKLKLMLNREIEILTFPLRYSTYRDSTPYGLVQT